MKHMKRICALFLSLVLTLSLVTPAVPAAAAASSGTTYYVSTLRGSDSYDGQSETTPFYSLNKINDLTLGAGDKVLLERGSVFEDQFLHVKGSGADKNPIIIDAYGAGEKPLINTNGNGVWYQNYGQPLDNASHVWRGYVSSSILLFDVEFIEISNIAMTNGGDPAKVKDGPTVPGETGYSASGVAGSYTSGTKMNRTGVAVVTQDIGTADHIYLKDLDIQNIYGNIYDKHMNNGGIYFTVAKPHNEATTGIARFNDVLIDGCYLNHTSRWGIALAYTYKWGEFTSMAIPDAVCEKYGATNVIIRNNYLEDVGGDPITTMYAFEPLIEYNVSEKGAREITSYYHNDSGKGNRGTVAAGIWPWKCKTALFQYNECYNLTGPDVGNGDGQAWDADWGDSTIYQYNYSAGNAGGCVMACDGQAYNTAFRYNISYKDGVGSGVLNTCSAPNAKYYNNTFIIAENVPVHRPGMDGGYPVLENNIFYYMGSTARTEDWERPGGRGGRYIYDNNLYVNYINVPKDGEKCVGDKNAKTAASAADVFATTPVGPTVPLTTKGEHGWTHNWESDFNSFKLKDGSPAINAGISIDLLRGLASDHGVDAATKDFYGTTLDASHDIGAHDTAIPDLKLASKVYTVNQAAKTIAKVPNGVTVANFLKNVTIDTGVTVQVKKGSDTLSGAAILDMDCVVVLTYNDTTATYTLVKDGDKDIKSSVFELEKDRTTGVPTGKINVPFGEGFSVGVRRFLAGVTVASTATAKVYDGATEVASGNNIADGMTLKITAQDGTAQDYTIQQKNVYNHSADWINKPIQGNVWYAQMKKNGNYANMTGWDTTYYCWAGSNYASVEHYSICGDTTVNSDKASTSMAFQAPVSGTVRVSFGAQSGTVGSNEIKFRNTNPNGANGVVSMLITKNGITLPDHTYVLNKAAATPVAPFEMTLEKGDMLRFEAQNTGSTPNAGFAMIPIITYIETDVDADAPTAPGRVNVAPSTSGGVVTWDASTDNKAVTGYKVYLDGAADPVGTTDSATLTYTLAGLLPGTSYTLAVTALDAAGNESDPAQISFTTVAVGGGETPTITHLITATAGAGGKITPASTRVPSGGSRTFQMTADKDYVLTDLLLDGVSVSFETVANGWSYTLTNVRAAHSLVAVFTLESEITDPDTPLAGLPFTDVTGHWAASAIAFVAKAGLMTGTGTTTFSAEGTATRATVATILYRMAGSPAVEQGTSFTDVDAGSWYAAAVTWCAGNGVIDGVSATAFAPDREITRQELATMLCRYAKHTGAATTATGERLSAFPDNADIAAWAREAMAWCTETGILTGKSGGLLAPQGTATRAELATMLERLATLLKK